MTEHENFKFNPDLPEKYLSYWDANSLYGWTLSQCLPSHGFGWLLGDEIQNLIFTVSQMAQVKVISWKSTLNVYLTEALRDEHNELPFFYLNNKQNYIIHYKNLKQALNHGLILVKIHRALEFAQCPCVKKYIDLNSGLRQLASNDFEKDFFKLMNTSVFGIAMEDVLKRADIKLIHWEDIGKKTGCSKFDF